VGKCPVDCPTCDALRDRNEKAEAMMDRLMAANRQPATSKRVLFDAATLLAATEWRETLAANLASAGALCVAWRLSAEYARDLLMRQRFDQWRPNLDGRPAPGWER
jgi:hypothetical protein